MPTVNVPVPLYAIVPPDAVTVAVVVPPQVVIVPANADAVSVAGCVTVTEAVVAVQPRASVMLVPACLSPVLRSESHWESIQLNRRDLDCRR